MKSADKEFDKREEELFYGIIERNPIAGTHLGLHQYDDLMPEGTLAAVEEDLDFLRRCRAGFEEIDSKGLTADKQVDRDVALGFLDLTLFYGDELRVWEMRPVAPDTVGDAVFLIFAKDYAPLRDRLRSIRSRLEKSPGYIRDTKETLRRPVKLWTEIGAESCGYLPGLLDTIVSTAKDKLPEREFKELRTASEETKTALAEHMEWLKDRAAGAKEKWTLTDAQFKKLLALRRIEPSVDEIMDVGRTYLANEKKKLEAMTKKLNIKSDMGSVKAYLDSRRLGSFDEILGLFRKSVDDSRRFVIERKLATMPPNESLAVKETPDYLAHLTPFACYFSPGKFDKNQLGLYLVTRPKDGGESGKHNMGSIVNTSVHEGYPGHHLQLSCANTHPSLVRTISHATETVEGWAHYCEELMVELGYSDETTRLSQAVDAIWRAARVIIDLNLSTGKMSFEEAVGMLMNEVGMSKGEAEGEIKRYTQNPSYNISYLLGKHLIKELKDEVRGKMGNAYSDRFFHDTILYSGSLPMSFFKGIFDTKIRAPDPEGAARTVPKKARAKSRRKG